MEAGTQGCSAKEAREILDVRLRVWDALGIAWDELTDEQQDTLLATAQKQAAENDRAGI